MKKAEFSAFFGTKVRNFEEKFNQAYLAGFRRSALHVEDVENDNSAGCSKGIATVHVNGGLLSGIQRGSTVRSLKRLMNQVRSKR